MDNHLSVHKTLRVKSVMQELDLIPIFSVPYSPQYNGIESYFFLVKQEYKKALLQRIMKGQHLDARKLIIQSVRKVADAKATQCVNGGFHEILGIE